VRTIELDEASRIGGVKEGLRTMKVSSTVIDRLELAKQATHLLWRVAMLDGIPHRLRVEYGLILGELANAEVAILELRDGDARRIDGGWSSEEVVKRVTPWI